jgi:hypothetical protein
MAGRGGVTAGDTLVKIRGTAGPFIDATGEAGIGGCLVGP